MTVLVTGGAGFIGSCLARRLLGAGHAVVVVDNLFSGARANVPAGAEWVEGDIGRPETIAALPERRYDAVCHLAAQSSGAVSMEQPYYDFQSNATSTLLLTRWCLERGIGRFLYASSMAVYGNPVRQPVGETTALLPISYYGVSKLTSENLLRIAAAQGLRTTAFRMFNVYGPGQNMANLRQGMASIYLAYILQGVPVPVTGSLDRFRDFVFIDDVVEAWVRGLEMKATPSPVYNIASGRATTVRTLLRDLLGASGRATDYPVVERAAPPGDQFGLQGDTALAATELGWRPQVELAEGLRRFVAFVQASGAKSAATA